MFKINFSELKCWYIWYLFCLNAAVIFRFILLRSTAFLNFFLGTTKAALTQLFSSVFSKEYLTISGLQTK